MNTLTVDLGERSYPIHIGAGLLDREDLWRALVTSRQVMVVTNETVGPLYGDTVKRALTDFDVREVVLADGEQSKTLAALERIIDALLEAKFARDCTLVALGGGVVGDIAGFAAACYQRGVDYVQVPTTLLAQVDSSVGGKTAVNHTRGKNMVGAFHQPVGVIADTDTLTTLDPRELRAGLAEVIKYGFIWDDQFLEWLDTHLNDLLAREKASIEHAIRRSCEIKADVVSADERESGVRALLNFGHTFGHAIETGLGHGRVLHGEAVAAGMCLAASLSARLGMIPTQDAGRVESLVARAGLPTRAPTTLSTDRMLELMAVDKKVKAGRIRFVCLERIGKAVVVDDCDPNVVRATIDAMREAA